MEARYYEIQAAIVAECTVEEMFTDKRKRECVLARQLSMYFEKDTTKKSLAKIAYRFNKDHATCLTAIRTINDQRETNKEFNLLVSEYMNKCKAIKKEIEERRLGIDVISQYGVAAFIGIQNSALMNLIHTMDQYIKDKATDDDILGAASEAETAIIRIKYIFEV